MARRKTIDVEVVKEWANQQLESADWATNNPKIYRYGIMNMLENVLMSTGNYKGFRYLGVDEIPAGCTPGVRRDRDADHLFDNTDNTRVRYF